MARSHFTGAQAAERLISSGGLNVNVDAIRGNLSDNYDPRQKVLHLSEGVYNSASVASLAIAAHELGHAMQDRDGYFPLRLRAAMVPAVNIGSYLGWILIFHRVVSTADHFEPCLARCACLFRWRDLRPCNPSG